MRPSSRIAVASLALAALAAPAAVAAPSGDTCSATGSGTSYAVVVTLPSTAPEQDAFAVGAGSVAVKSLNATGNPGSMTTQNLPAGASAAWTLSNPPSAPAGSSISLAVTTSAPISGSLTVVPSAGSGTGTPLTWLDAVTCQVTPSHLPDNAFTVRGPYVHAGGVWHATVVVPGPGRILYAQGGTTAKPLVRRASVSASHAGSVRLTISPTAAGRAALATKGSLKVGLSITFVPKDGKGATKLVRVTLTR